MLPKVRRSTKVGFPDHGPRVLPRRFIAVASAVVKKGVGRVRPFVCCYPCLIALALPVAPMTLTCRARACNRTQQLGNPLACYQGWHWQAIPTQCAALFGQIQISQRCFRDVIRSSVHPVTYVLSSDLPPLFCSVLG